MHTTKFDLSKKKPRRAFYFYDSAFGYKDG